MIRDPRGVLAEFGFEPGPAVKIDVWDSSTESRYLVLPRRPAGTEELSEQALVTRVTHNGLIGIAPV